MDALKLTHLILICLWAGLVAGESILEFSWRNEAEGRQVARVHFWTDVLVEIPLLLGILATGGHLMARAWPPTPLHWLKLGCAAGALAANAWCAALVIARHRTADDGDAARVGRRLRWAWVGVPFGLAALYIGLRYFH